jgi:hypothetical protein
MVTPEADTRKALDDGEAIFECLKCPEFFREWQIGQ